MKEGYDFLIELFIYLTKFKITNSPLYQKSNIFKKTKQMYLNKIDFFK